MAYSTTIVMAYRIKISPYMYYVYRPLAVGMTVGVTKRAAAILEYNAWAFSMGHKYRERVCSSFAVSQNEWSA